MADATVTTPAQAQKAASAFTHTAVSNRFVQLLDTLDRAIDAERDVAHVWSHDPAFRDWRDDAELLWQRAAEEAEAVFTAPALRPADRVLIEAARVLHYALGCEHPAEYHAAVADLAGCGERLALRRESALTGRTRAMLRRAEAQLTEIGELEMIPAADDLDLLDGLDAWPPIAC